MLYEEAHGVFMIECNAKYGRFIANSPGVSYLRGNPLTDLDRLNPQSIHSSIQPSQLPILLPPAYEIHRFTFEYF